MTKGKIKFYDSTKEYGFIICEDKLEIFFHKSNFEKEESAQNLKTDDELEFEIGEGNRGKKAIKIRKIKGGKTK